MKLKSVPGDEGMWKLARKVARPEAGEQQTASQRLHAAESKDQNLPGLHRASCLPSRNYEKGSYLTPVPSIGRCQLQIGNYASTKP